MTPSQRRTFLQKEIKEQKKWIVMCGGDLEGYINRYGSKNDPKHYGDGGEAIYAADSGQLEKLQTMLTEVEADLRKRKKRLSLPIDKITVVKRRGGTDVVYFTFDTDGFPIPIPALSNELGCRFDVVAGGGEKWLKELLGNDVDFEVVKMEGNGVL